jgi:hypothetical protein
VVQTSSILSASCHFFAFTVIMRIRHASSLALALSALTSALPSSTSRNNPLSCRFALQWSQQEVLDNTDDFINDLLYWEGMFHQNNVSYNAVNGMSYDGTQLDWNTGTRTEKHPFSAASKEVSQRDNCRVSIEGS